MEKPEEKPVERVEEMSEMLSDRPITNPKVFMAIQIGNKQAGRVIIELRADVVPRTAGNILSYTLVSISHFVD